MVVFTNYGAPLFPENLPAGMVMRDWLRTHRREFSRMAREMVECSPHFQAQFIRHGWGEPVTYEDALNHQVFAIAGK
jgi:hypothetical protein